MNLNFPPKNNCIRIYVYLSKFYESNKDNKSNKLNDYHLFDKALRIFCSYYNIQLPEIKFRRKIDDGRTLGLCFDDGRVRLIYPYSFHRRGEQWVSVWYHEMSHYVFWAKAEVKALEAELKLMKRSKKVKE